MKKHTRIVYVSDLMFDFCFWSMGDHISIRIVMKLPANSPKHSSYFKYVLINYVRVSFLERRGTSIKPIFEK